MTTRIDCSEAGFSEFLLANPQLDGHADLIWQLHAVYWRNKRLGHPKAVGLLIQCVLQAMPPAASSASAAMVMTTILPRCGFFFSAGPVGSSMVSSSMAFSFSVICSPCP